jgi:hypothetical protein
MVVDQDVYRKAQIARDMGFRRVWQLPQQPLVTSSTHGPVASPLGNPHARLQYRLQRLQHDRLAQVALEERAREHKRGKSASRTRTSIGGGKSISPSRQLPASRVAIRDTLDVEYRQAAKLQDVKHEALAAVRVFKEHQATWMAIIQLARAASIMQGCVRQNRVSRINIAAVLFVQRMWRGFVARKQALRHRLSLEKLQTWAHRMVLKIKFRAKQRAAHKVVGFLVICDQQVSSFSIKRAASRYMRHVRCVQRCIRSFLKVQRHRLQLLLLWWQHTEERQRMLVQQRGNQQKPVSKPKVGRRYSASDATSPEPPSRAVAQLRRGSAIGPLPPPASSPSPALLPSSPERITNTTRTPITSTRAQFAKAAKLSADDDDSDSDLEIDAVWLAVGLPSLSLPSAFAMAPRAYLHVRDMPACIRRGSLVLMDAALSPDVMFHPSVTRNGASAARRPPAYATTTKNKLADLLETTAEVDASAAESAAPILSPGEQMLTAVKNQIVEEFGKKSSLLLPIDDQTRITVLKSYLARRLLEAAQRVARLRAMRRQIVAIIQHQEVEAAEDAQTAQEVRAARIAKRFIKQAKGSQPSLVPSSEVLANLDAIVARRLLQLKRRNSLFDEVVDIEASPDFTLDARQEVLRYDYDCSFPAFRLLTAAGARAMPKLIAIARYRMNQHVAVLESVTSSTIGPGIEALERGENSHAT